MSSQWVDFAAIAKRCHRASTPTLPGAAETRAERLSPWLLSTANTQLRTEPGELWRGHQQGRVGLSFGFLLSGTLRQSGWEYSGPGGVYGGLFDSRGGAAAESLGRCGEGNRSF